MHSIGSRVLYRASGVCTVAAVEEAELHPGERKLYCILAPQSDPQSRLYIPADNEALTSQIRPLMTEEEALSFIDRIEQIPLLWEEDGRARTLLFRTLLARADREELCGMVKALRSHRASLLALGKKFYASDEASLKKAEKLLFEELSASLSLPQDEVLPLIRQRTGRQVFAD